MGQRPSEPSGVASRRLMHRTEVEPNGKGRRDGGTLPTSLAAVVLRRPKTYLAPRLRSGGTLPPCCPFPMGSGAVLCII